jgi:lysophospholipase L1-like esterase
VDRKALAGAGCGAPALHCAPPKPGEHAQAAVPGWHRPLPLSSAVFNAEYHGHSTPLLCALVAGLRPRPLLFLAGDSTLDCKYWLRALPRVAAAAGMERLVSPPLAPPDVAAALNALLPSTRHLSEHAAVNCAVEESTLRARSHGTRLLPQDALIAARLRTRDVLVISVGGNDVVLSPTLSTATALARVLCCGDACGGAGGYAALASLFRDELQALVDALTARATPAVVVVCFPYFPQEFGGAGAAPAWADGALRLLGYARDPAPLQRAMRAVFARATRGITGPPGACVAHLALFDVLDAAPGSGDYVDRVEPSARGARKIARAIVDAVEAVMGDAQARTGAADECAEDA